MTTMEKVVKCKNCGLYYGYSDAQKKCPFPSCGAPYKPDEEKPKGNKEVPIKVTMTKKDKERKSFKMWG